MKELLKRIITESLGKNLDDVLQRDLILPTDSTMIVSLIGSRRSGKTYHLYSVIKHLLNSGLSRKQILYLNFEDERLSLSAGELDIILQSYFELFPDIKPAECYFMFDEIQNVPGWEKFVRRIFDNVSKHIFVTGSNSKLLSTEIATSLRGRTISYKVYPLNFAEFLRFKQIEINLYDTQKLSAVIKAQMDYIMKGAFPELIFLNDDLRHRALQSYFDTMVLRDIIERYSIGDAQTLKYFIKKMFSSIGSTLSINKIYNDIKSMGYKVSNNYLYNYEEYCYNIFLAHSVSKFDFSEIKQAKADKKVYAIDTGLVSAIEFSISENRGKLLENTVALEFVKSGADIYYFKQQYECDFIVKNKNELLPVQVCWSVQDNDTLQREIRGLVSACKHVNSKSGIIITFDETAERTVEDIDIKIIPFYKYFLK